MNMQLQSMRSLSTNHNATKQGEREEKNRKEEI